MTPPAGPMERQLDEAAHAQASQASQPSQPSQPSQHPQALDALALQLTGLQHALAGIMGQVQSALVLVQLELLARGGAAAPQPGSLTHPATRASMGLPPLPVGHPGAPGNAPAGPPATFGRKAAAPAAAPAPSPETEGGTDGNDGSR